MARNGRGTFTTKSKGAGGRAKETRASKNERLASVVPIYAIDDLPESVRDVLKALYPKSKYV